MLRHGTGLLCYVALLFIVVPCAAVDVYFDPQAFITSAFDNEAPKPKKLWIKGPLKAQIRSILGTGLGALRMKYWLEGARTAWVLEAIGRDRPITAGFVVENDEIVQVAILIYRESRGWEVRYPFFTDQFHGARMTEDINLDRNIDGITGATLSVRAITDLTKVALLLHREAQEPVQ